MSHGNYLDCGCYIDESGHRAFCPTCDSAYLLRWRINEAPRFTTWVYKQSEPGLWTVGHYDPCGNWYTDSDHDSKREASERAAILNGYNTDEVCLLKLKIDDLEAEVQDLKSVRRWLAGVIKDFAIPHMALDCERTPADQYDELMSDYTVACHAIVDAYEAIDWDKMTAREAGKEANDA